MFLILDVLSAAPHALSIIVLFLVFRRKLEKQSPFFVGYLIFNVIAFVTFFTMAQILVRASTYQSALFVYICIYTTLTLGVIYELGNALLMSRSSLIALLRSVLRWSLAALVLAAAIGSAFLHEIDIPHWKFVEPLDVSSALIRAGMLFTLFAFAWALRISWQKWTAGIALGFGITACVDLASAPLRAAFGSTAIHAVDIIQLSGYNVAVLVWLIYLLLPDRKLRFAVNICHAPTWKLGAENYKTWFSGGGASSDGSIVTSRSLSAFDPVDLCDVIRQESRFTLTIRRPYHAPCGSRPADYESMSVIACAC